MGENVFIQISGGFQENRLRIVPHGGERIYSDTTTERKLKKIVKRTKKSPKNEPDFKVRTSNVAELWDLRRQINYYGGSGVVKIRGNRGF